MKYINVFETESAFNDVSNNLEKPQLSYITDGGKIFSLSAGGGGSDVEFVDLGLSVKWAKYNVGATGGDTVESWYGNYYAWGETATKSDYAGDNYAHGEYDENGKCISLSKYNTDSTYGTPDGKETLDTTDDAAYIYSSEMRMPTKADFEDLIKNTAKQWVTAYGNISGLNGYTFTSRKDSTKSIFIPAAGLYDGSERYGAGEEGCVWSASLRSNYPSSVFYLNFEPGVVGVYGCTRYDGLPVRGVQNSPAN